MKKTYLLPAVAAALTAGLLLASCGYTQARSNRERLSGIRVGMTHAQVRAVMGEPPAESYQEKNLWFYYTDPKWYDGCATRDECTPFVFDEDEDRLLGFGYEYYKSHCSLDDWSEKAIDATLKK